VVEEDGPTPRLSLAVDPVRPLDAVDETKPDTAFNESHEMYSILDIRDR